MTAWSIEDGSEAREGEGEGEEIRARTSSAMSLMEGRHRVSGLIVSHPTRGITRRERGRQSYHQSRVVRPPTVRSSPTHFRGERVRGG